MEAEYLLTAPGGAPSKKAKIAPDMPLERQDEVFMLSKGPDEELEALRDTVKIMVGERVQQAAMAVVGRLVKNPSSGFTQQGNSSSSSGGPVSDLLNEEAATGQRLQEQLLGEAGCTTQQFVQHFNNAYASQTGQRHPSDQDIEELVRKVTRMPLYKFCKDHAGRLDFLVLDNFNSIKGLWKKKLV